MMIDRKLVPVALAVLAAVLVVACAWWNRNPEARAVTGGLLEQSDRICSTIAEDDQQREVCVDAAAMARLLIAVAEASEAAERDEHTEPAVDGSGGAS
jgi:hypothetical protein